MHITNIDGYIPSKYTSEMSKQSRYLSLFSQYGSYMYVMSRTSENYGCA